ncbi:serine/threonine protein kinase [Myxococcota bacterium]|nr:serine/threonine protein kinase [Myxococcota bacterium]
MDQEDLSSGSEKTSSGRMRPRQFGKYTLLEKIGMGGMAEIFKAVARGAGDFQKVLVVKRILLRYSHDPAFVKMFKDEALITAPLQHANIVSIYEFDQVDGQYFLAMELVNGVDLQALMARANKIGGSVPVSVALFVVGEVCKALWYAYNARDAYGKDLKVIHRDVSPSNILLSFDGEVKVTDFGVAKATTSKGETTQNGVLKGKLGYMSPETVLGRDVDHRSDIFSLGIILFELLTLKRMFLGKTDLQTLINIRDADVEKRLSRHPEIDPGVADIIRKALAKNPDDRYTSANEFLEGIQDYQFSHRMRTSQNDLAAMMKDLFSEKVERELLPLSIDDTTGVGPRTGVDAVRDFDEPNSEHDDESDESSAPAPFEAEKSAARATTPVADNAVDRESSEPEIDAAIEESCAVRDLPLDERPSETVGESTRNTRLKPEVSSFRIKDSSGKVFGPVSFDNLMGLLKSRAVTEDELVSVDDGDWSRLGDLSMVQNYLSEIRPSLDRSRLLFEGAIERRFLVRMFTRICVKQTLTGLLVFRKGLNQKEIFFVEGRPRVIFSNLKTELFGEFLVNRDVVGRNKLAEAVSGLGASGGRLGDTLVAHGAVPAHQMALLLNDQFKERFLQVFDWDDGWCGFFDDVRIPAGVVQQDLEPMSMISQGVRTRIPVDIVNAWMSEHSQHRFLFGSESRVSIDDLKLIPREMRVVNLIGSRDSIRAIQDGLPQSGDWASVVNRVIYLLLETGIIRFRAGR